MHLKPEGRHEEALESLVGLRHDTWLAVLAAVADMADPPRNRPYLRLLRELPPVDRLKRWWGAAPGGVFKDLATVHKKKKQRR